MTPGRRYLASVLLLSLLLAACTPAPLPAVTATAPPQPSVVPPATSLPVPTPAATATPASSPTAPPTRGAGELPPGWEHQGNDRLTIAIPPGWRVILLSGEDAEAVYETLKEDSPQLAGILGGPEALVSAAFWAFGPEGSTQEQDVFVDNMSVRRSPLGAQRITDMQQVVDVLLPEYEKLGLVVTSTDPALRIAGFPAARITYTLTSDADDDRIVELRGRQYIVATDEDLWILSYTTTPEREGQLAPDFETSAQSFRPK